jgi:DNA-binding MarR family transcriptional regulator
MSERHVHAADLLTVSRTSLLEDGSDARFRQLVHDLLALSARLESIRSQMGAHLGLTGVQYTILISVRQLQAGQGIGVKAVAEHLGLSGAFVTSETGKLIKAGLLGKRADPRDGRRVLLNVSGKGIQLLARLAPAQQEINDTIFGSLDARTFQALCAQATALRNGSDDALALSQYLLNAQQRGDG